MHIQEDFNAGAPISQVPASWFTSVAKFINSLVGGVGTVLNKHDDGYPSEIRLDTSAIASSATPKDVAETAAAGSDTTFSRADHIHKDRKIFDSDQTLNGMFTYTHSDGVYYLTFNPPKFDKYGRFIGYGTATQTWPIAVLDDSV